MEDGAGTELERARRTTDALFALVRDQALYARPLRERHRLIFYRGHLEAFEWNLIGRGGLGLGPDGAGGDAELDRRFAFGIDPTDGRLPDEPASDWPRREVVEEYVRRARARLDRALAGPAARALAPGLLEAALEHRLMHAETLCYLLHELPFADKRAPAADPRVTAPAAPPAAPAAVDIDAGVVRLGRARGAPGFAWDNEHEEHAVAVPGFAIGRHPVTNAEVAAFVDAGGYKARELWSDADWAWREGMALDHPVRWRRDGGGWHERGMFAEAPLVPEHPAWVSHAEASAFARWRGLELPSEAEWQRAAEGAWDGPPRRAGEVLRGNACGRRWGALPVAAHPGGASAHGVHDLTGNGWEWTRTPFAPFPGFVAQSFYPGYSADFFDGRHFVLKGASPRTARRFLRPSFRNWFQPHFPYVYAKFRLVSR